MSLFTLNKINNHKFYNGVSTLSKAIVKLNIFFKDNPNNH